jgi:hypothetical protein
MNMNMKDGAPGWFPDAHELNAASSQLRLNEQWGLGGLNRY